MGSVGPRAVRAILVGQIWLMSASIHAQETRPIPRSLPDRGGVTPGSLVGHTLFTKPDPDKVEEFVPLKGSLHIASLNMQGPDKDGLRLKKMAAQLRAQLDKLGRGEPDAFVLQEAIALGSDSSTAHRLQQELKKLGLDYHVVFIERHNPPGDQREGLAVLSRHPFREGSLKSIKLSDPTPEEIGNQRWWPRISMSVDVEHPTLGTVRIVNTHLESSLEGTQTRRRQIRETQDWISKLQKEFPAGTTILGGDFNPNTTKTDFRTKELSGITEPANPAHVRFRDTNSDRHTWSGKEAGTPMKRRLDYVFINEKPGLVHRFESVDTLAEGTKELTDHRMVMHAWDLYER